MTAPIEALDYEDDIEPDVDTWIEAGSCCARCHAIYGDE